MGTQATIAIQNTDGSVEGIYIHYDGYLSHVGKVLVTHYSSESKVRRLLKLGDLRCLGPKIGKKHGPNPHVFGTSEYVDFNQQCDAFGRDHGETGTEARKSHSWKQFLIENGETFNYLFSPNEGWKVQTSSGVTTI
jgi:hypothetical protein